MTFKAITLSLLFAAAAAYSDYWWSCVADPAKACVNITSAVKHGPGYQCAPCLEESTKCAQCVYIQTHPDGSDTDHMWSNWWGAGILCVIAILFCICTPVGGVIFYLGRCIFDLCGGRYPNRALFAPKTPATLPPKTGGLLAPNGVPLRAYTATEIKVAKWPLVFLVIVFLFTFICSIVSAAYSVDVISDTIDSVFRETDQIHTDVLAFVDETESIMQRDLRIYKTMANDFKSARQQIRNIVKQREDVSTFERETGRDLNRFMNALAAMLIVWTFLVLVIIIIGTVMAFMKMRRVWPHVLASSMFVTVFIGWVFAVATIFPAILVPDACDSFDGILYPAANELSPLSGVLTVWEQFDSEPLAIVDYGRVPEAAFTEGCAAIMPVCTATPLLTCTLWNECVMPTNPTLTQFYTFLNESSFTLLNQTTTFMGCARGEGACDCAQYGSISSPEYAVCNNTISPEAGAVLKMLRMLEDFRALVLREVTAKDGSFNIDVLRGRMDPFVEACHDVGRSFVWTCVTCWLVGIFGLVAICLFILGNKRWINAGEIPYFPEVERKAAPLIMNDDSNEHLPLKEQPSQLDATPTPQYHNPNPNQSGNSTLTGAQPLNQPRPVSAANSVVELFAGPDGALYMPADQVPQGASVVASPAYSSQVQQPPQQQPYSSQIGSQYGGTVAQPTPAVADPQWAMQDDQWPAPQVAF